LHAFSDKGFFSMIRKAENTKYIISSLGLVQLHVKNCDSISKPFRLKSVIWGNCLKLVL
jgi:hypothetical protein